LHVLKKLNFSLMRKNVYYYGKNVSEIRDIVENAK
jgi:hypothetical protein